MVPRALKFIYYIMILCAFCANMIVVSHTTALSVLGAGLALRGPDGSMVTATDGLYDERISVFTAFAIGLACTVGSVVVCVWLILHWEAALICMTLSIYTVVKIYQNYRRVVRRFVFDEDETVNFDDIFSGPAAIQVVKSGIRTLQNTLTMSPRRSKMKYDVENQHSDPAPILPDMNNATKRRATRNGN